jgi:hypothetical protein
MPIPGQPHGLLAADFGRDIDLAKSDSQLIA